LPDDSINCFRGTPRAAAFASTCAIRSEDIMSGRSSGTALSSAVGVRYSGAKNDRLGRRRRQADSYRDHLCHRPHRATGPTPGVVTNLGRARLHNPRNALVFTIHGMRSSPRSTGCARLHDPRDAPRPRSAASAVRSRPSARKRGGSGRGAARLQSSDSRRRQILASDTEL
jgi:hypothetical protein